MATPARGPEAIRHRILFVDDDAAFRMVTPAILGSEGYDVMCAGDGLEALQLIKASIPEMIISDLRMPRMSGFELLSIVRRRYPQMPLIAISGEFLSGTEMMGIADAFFSKGAYSPVDLCQTVAALFSKPPGHCHLQSPPIWVPVGSSGEVVLTCTDCLRSFPVRVCPPEIGNPVRETDCIVCGTHLRYCVDNTGMKVGGRPVEGCRLLQIGKAGHS